MSIADRIALSSERFIGVERARYHRHLGDAAGTSMTERLGALRGSTISAD